MFWSDSGYGKIVFFLGSKLSRHPEGLSFTGLRSEFSRSALSRHHVRNAFGRDRRRIKSSSSYTAATKNRGHDCCRTVGLKRLLHKNLFRKVPLFVSQSTKSTDFRVSTKHWPPVNWPPTDPPLTPLLTSYKINGKMKIENVQNYQWDRLKFINKNLAYLKLPRWRRRCRFLTPFSFDWRICHGKSSTK